MVSKIRKSYENPNSGLPTDRLPSAIEILGYFFFLSTGCKFSRESLRGVAHVIGDELRSVWKKVLPGIPMIGDT